MNDPTMNDMLARIAVGMETTEQSLEEIKSSLKERGYDPDSSLPAFKQRLSMMVMRTTWKVDAQAKQAAFTHKLASLVSWATKSADEIDAAFQKVLSGEKVQQPLALAFRNLEEITREDKIAILDDLALLNHDDESHPQHDSSR